MWYFDSSMLIVLPALLLSLWAQSRVQAAYQKYSRVASQRGWTGAEMARDMLERAGIQMPVRKTAGHLSDHYDPKRGEVRLSEGVYDATSVAALGIAAHEIGHVLQQQEQYAPFWMRQKLVPLAHIASQAATPLFFLGLVLGFEPLLWAGILVFMAVVLFYLVTLPLEWNASKRALEALENGGYLTRDEIPSAKGVLNAAALTYLAAALQAVLTLLRLAVLAGRRNSRD